MFSLNFKAAMPPKSARMVLQATKRLKQPPYAL